ncbi:MAG TPA: hypothetical protein VGD74_06285, partial [Vulgatibacter sp.]
GDWLRTAVGDGDAPERRYGVAPSSQPPFARDARAAGAREAAEALWPREGDRVSAGAVVPGTASGFAKGAAWPGEPAAGSGSGGAAAIAWRTGAGARDQAEAIADVALDAPGAGPGDAAGLQLVGVLESGYLVCESAGGVAIVDPTRLREGIALARLRAFAEAGEKGQPFLFPVIVDPGMPVARDLLARIEEVRSLGFELEPFGGTTFAVQSVPPPMVGLDYESLLAGIATALSGEDGRERALRFMAARAAAAPQPALLDEEASRLLEEFEREAAEGAPLVLALSIDELHRRAGRR